MNELSVGYIEIAKLSVHHANYISSDQTVPMLSKYIE